jgi:transposase
MLSIQLDDDERQILVQIRRATSDPRSEKALAVLLLSDGNTVPAIANQLKRHHHTIRDWLKRYKKYGLHGLARKFSPGRPSIRKNKIEPFIEGLIGEPPENHGYQRNCWTIEMLRCEYDKYTGKKTSVDSIKRALKDLGYSYKRAKATPPANSPAKEEKIARIGEITDEIQRIISEAEFDIFAIDESHFSTQPYLPRGWFKKRYPHAYSYTQKKGELFSFRCITDQGWEFLLEKRKVR